MRPGFRRCDRTARHLPDARLGVVRQRVALLRDSPWVAPSGFVRRDASLGRLGEGGCLRLFGRFRLPLRLARLDRVNVVGERRPGCTAAQRRRLNREDQAYGWSLAPVAHASRRLLGNGVRLWRHASCSSGEREAERRPQ